MTARFFYLKLLLRLWLLAVCCLCSNNAQRTDIFKLVKHKVHPSSWVVDITVRNVLSMIACASLCVNNNQCSALTYSNGDCSMGSGGITKRVNVPPFVEVYILPGRYKIAVVGGDRLCGGDSLVNSAQIIDMGNPKSTCLPLPNLVKGNCGLAAGIDYSNRPFYCGGYDPTYSLTCYVLSTTTGNWLPTNNLVRARVYPAMARNPFSDSPLYFIGGGYRYNGNNAEYLTNTGWVDAVQTFDQGLSLLCAAFFNESTVIFVGGAKGTASSPRLGPVANTYFWNTNTLQVSAGPALLSPNEQNVCGRILESQNGGESTIIVAGGLATSGVEVFDRQLNIWKMGNQMPTNLTGSVMLEDPLGGVLVLGGYSSVLNSAVDTIYRLADAAPSTKWQLLDQKLSIKMCMFAVFIIPDIYTNCTTH